MVLNADHFNESKFLLQKFRESFFGGRPRDNRNAFAGQIGDGAQTGV